MENQAKILYKYSSTDSALQILSNRTILAPNPEKFNDPFDCSLSELISNPETINEIIRRELNKKLHQQIGWSVKNHKITDQDTGISTHIELIKKLWNEFIRNNGIICLSEVNDSILMWSHYANKHSGVAIGFNEKFFKKNTEKVTYGNGNTIFKKEFEKIFTDALNSAKRTKKEILLGKFSNDFFSLCRAHMLLKNEIWSYEYEHRFIINNDKKEVIDAMLVGFDEDMISEVILGINFCNSNEHDKLIKLIKEKYPSITLKEARKNGENIKIFPQ